MKETGEIGRNGGRVVSPEPRQRRLVHIAVPVSHYLTLILDCAATGYAALNLTGDPHHIPETGCIHKADSHKASAKKP